MRKRSPGMVIAAALLGVCMMVAQAAEPAPTSTVELIRKTFIRLQEAESSGDVAGYRACLVTSEREALEKRLAQRGLTLTKDILAQTARSFSLEGFTFRELRQSGARAVVWYTRPLADRDDAMEHFFLCCELERDGWKIGPRVHARQPLLNKHGEEMRFMDLEHLEGLSGWLARPAATDGAKLPTSGHEAKRAPR